jgi:hypothetical protein
MRSTRAGGSIRSERQRARLTQPFVGQLYRGNLLGEPAGQLGFVVLAESAEPQGPVVLERAPGPLVIDQFARVDSYLAGHVVDGCRWVLAGVAREAGVDLEELQHQREPEERRATLVGDQLPFV